MAENPSVASLLNPASTKCPNFDGTTCFEWLVFLPQWKAFMSHHRVDEIIQKGTFKNLSFKALDSDGPSIADSYLQWTKEQELEMKKSLKEELYTIFMKQSTWVPYVLDGMKVPVGASTGEALIRTPYAATGVYNNELKVIQKKLCPFGEVELYVPIVEGDANDPLLPSFHIYDMAGEAATEIAKTTYCKYKNVKAILAGKPYDAVDPTPAVTESAFLTQVAKLDQYQIAEIYKINKAEMKDFMATSKTLADLTTKCIMCFEKIAPSKREQISEEIARCDFFGAYKKLNAFYVRVGAGNIKAFEDEAESYRLQPGQDLGSHFEAIHQAFSRWAGVSWLNSVLHIAEGDAELTAKAIDVPDRVCHWNSGCMTDAAIIQANLLEPIDPFNGLLTAGKLLSPVLIPESRRFQILQKSVIHNPRFRTVAQAFSSMNENERTVTALTIRMSNQESSPEGIEALQREKQANPGYAAAINQYLTNIKAHLLPTASAPAIVAHLTEVAAVIPQISKGARKRVARELREQESGESALVTAVEKHCINHPNSKSHTTAECNTRPKGNTKRAHVETNNRRQQQPQQQLNQNQSNWSQGSQYSGPPCNYCQSQRRYAQTAHTHSSNRCRLDPMRNQNRNPNSSSYQRSPPEANLSATMNSLMATMAQVNENFAAHLNKDNN